MEPEKLLPVGESIQHIGTSSTTPGAVPGVPSQKQQSWGVVISIVVIVGMIVVGAFYAWGKRISQERAFTTPVEAQ